MGNLGDIYWNELNTMINKTFKDLNNEYSKFSNNSLTSQLINDSCIETLKISAEIGNFIRNLHKSLISPEEQQYSLESVDSKIYLKNYTEYLNSMISELLGQMTHQPESAFSNLPKISSILIDIKDIIERFRVEFKETNINIQPVHQDLHMEQPSTRFG
ncbi:MAG: hypothetical protein ACW96X_13795 [Promethearchaeota archaeon]|jgi:predicted trehalose synthase